MQFTEATKHFDKIYFLFKKKKNNKKKRLFQTPAIILYCETSYLLCK